MRDAAISCRCTHKEIRTSWPLEEESFQHGQSRLQRIITTSRKSPRILSTQEQRRRADWQATEKHMAEICALSLSKGLQGRQQRSLLIKARERIREEAKQLTRAHICRQRPVKAGQDPKAVDGQLPPPQLKRPSKPIGLEATPPSLKATPRGAGGREEQRELPGYRARQVGEPGKPKR